MRWEKETGFDRLLKDRSVGPVHLALEDWRYMWPILQKHIPDLPPWTLANKPCRNLSRVLVDLYAMAHSLPLQEKQMHDLYMITFAEVFVNEIAKAISVRENGGKVGMSPATRDILYTLLYSVHVITNPTAQPPRSSDTKELLDQAAQVMEQIKGQVVHVTAQ